MSTERWVSRDGDKVYLYEENDGWTFMNRGSEQRRTEIVNVEENGLRLAGGGFVGSSTGRLEQDAMEYFAAIEKESKDRQA